MEDRTAACDTYLLVGRIRTAATPYQSSGTVVPYVPVTKDAAEFQLLRRADERWNLVGSGALVDAAIVRTTCKYENTHGTGTSTYACTETRS